MNPDRRTIFALSSGAPPAAIAIIRISGPDASAAVNAMAGRVPEPRRASLATLFDPVDGRTLDQALILYFPGPATATGEDLAELHLHGGRAVVAAVLAALAKLNHLVPAEPGEFTRRAFDNGRIDLTEAEGLADLLAAETESQRRAALAMAGGALGRMIGGWQDRILAVAGQVEAVLDFSDEGDVPEGEAWRGPIEALANEIAAALARPAGERLRDGIRVVVAGPPNAGKSTLLNALAGREVAITSPIAGTTRDVVEAPLALNGRPYVLVDTAGLRDSIDAIETIGIQRARDRIDDADLILWLGDPDFAEGGDPRRIIRVAAKADISSSEASADVAVSAVTGEGLDDLVALLEKRASDLLPSEGEVALYRRHRVALHEVKESLDRACAAPDMLIVAEELRLARQTLDRITGRAGVENMLDALFGRFCIGK